MYFVRSVAYLIVSLLKDENTVIILLTYMRFKTVLSWILYTVIVSMFEYAEISGKGFVNV